MLLAWNLLLIRIAIFFPQLWHLPHDAHRSTSVWLTSCFWRDFQIQWKLAVLITCLNKNEHPLCSALQSNIMARFARIHNHIRFRHYFHSWVLTLIPIHGLTRNEKKWKFKSPVRSFPQHQLWIVSFPLFLCIKSTNNNTYNYMPMKFRVCQKIVDCIRLHFLRVVVRARCACVEFKWICVASHPCTVRRLLLSKILAWSFDSIGAAVCWTWVSWSYHVPF